MVSVTTGLGIIEVTGYAGHHDRVIQDEVIRTFVFNVAVDDPERLCRWANVGHRWTTEPIAAWTTLVDNGPDSGAITTPALNAVEPRLNSSKLPCGPAPKAFSAPKQRSS